MKAFVLAMAICGLTSALFGQSVTLPKEVKGDVGRLLSLSIEFDGDDIKWTASRDVDIFREYDPDAKKIRLRLIAYKVGTFEVSAITTKDKKLSDFATCTIIVGGAPIPPPVPPPDPPPPPNTLPDGRYKFAKAVYDEAAKIPLPARSRATAVGDNYAGSSQSLSAQIAAGVTPTTADIQAALAALKEKNRASLGTDITAWSAWGAALTTKFNGHNADGSLRSGADYVDAFSEISIGLKAIPAPTPPAPTKPLAATYVFEKDDGAVPAAVLAALNRLNREKQILATVFEEDSVDGTGEVPSQYKVPLKAAQEAGLPALVVTAGDTVLRVVKNPRTEAQVLEIAP